MGCLEVFIGIEGILLGIINTLIDRIGKIGRIRIYTNRADYSLTKIGEDGKTA